MIPTGLDDAALSVWADAQLQAGDPLGEIVSLQLAGRWTEHLLREHAATLLGPLDGLVQPPGTWERARLVAIELVGIDPTPVLDALDQFPHVRTLDFGAHTPLAAERRRTWRHPHVLQLDEVRFRMPATWLQAYRHELERIPVPRFVVQLGHGTLTFEHHDDGLTLTPSGHHPLIERAVALARRALPVV